MVFTDLGILDKQVNLPDISNVPYLYFHMLIVYVFLVPKNDIFTEEIGLLSVLSSLVKYIFLFSNLLFMAIQVNSKSEQRT